MSFIYYSAFPEEKPVEKPITNLYQATLPSLYQVECEGVVTWVRAASCTEAIIRWKHANDFENVEPDAVRLVANPDEYLP